VLRFVDICAGTHTVCPKAIEAAVNSKTRAILPVHTYGLPADIADLRRIARDKDLYLVELCGQAFGAEFNAKPVGVFGHAACFSFNPTKLMGGIGDGGAVVTADPRLADKVRRLRNHGRLAVGDPVDFIGVLSRLDTYNARVLKNRLLQVDREIKRRRQLARQYHACLPNWCTPQTASPGKSHAYEHFVIEVKDRDTIRSKLQDCDIDTKIHYRLPYRMRGYKGHPLILGTGTLTETERAAQRVLTLPFGYGIGKTEIERVCATLAGL
jgi:dTDP-4-amino-4,6-dideoxygalactose transaminase